MTAAARHFFVSLIIALPDRDKKSWVITRNTIAYNLAFIAINTVLAIVVAIILSEIWGKAKKFYQSAILLPYLISSVIIG